MLKKRSVLEDVALLLRSVLKRLEKKNVYSTGDKL